MTRPLFALGLLWAASAVPSFGAVDYGLLALAPASTTVLMEFDVAKAKDSPFGKFVLQQTPVNFLKLGNASVPKSSFNLQDDLQQILLAAQIGKQGSGNQAIAFARGSFDVKAISALGSATMVSGVPVISFKKAAWVVAFPEPDIAVIGDRTQVLDVLAHQNAGPVLEPKLMDQVNAIGEKNDIWFATVVSGDAIQFGAPDASGLANLGVLRAVRQSSGGVQLGDATLLSLDLIARSDEDAKSVSDLLRFATNMAQMHASDPNAQMAAAALNSLQVTATGSAVHAQLKLTETQLEQFVKTSQQEFKPVQMPSH